MDTSVPSCGDSRLTTVWPKLPSALPAAAQLSETGTVDVRVVVDTSTADTNSWATLLASLQGMLALLGRRVSSTSTASEKAAVHK
jgi:hypothetical protein